MLPRQQTQLEQSFLTYLQQSVAGMVPPPLVEVFPCTVLPSQLTETQRQCALNRIIVPK